MQKGICKKFIFEATNLECAKKGLRNVQINDIVKKAGVSKTTFYRYFIDKNDVVIQYFDNILERILGKKKGTLTWNEFIYFFLEKDNDMFFFRDLLKSPENDFLKNHIRRADYIILSEAFQNKNNIDPVKKNLILKTYVNTLIELYCLWITECPDSPKEEMIGILNMVTPEICRYCFESKNIRDYIASYVRTEKQQQK